MAISSIIKEHNTSLIALCKKYGVERLYVFGSVAKGKFNPDTSDIDFIVELEELSPLEKGERLLSLWSELESLFQRKVDLLTDKPIVNPYFRKSVEKSKSLIYERRSEKIFV